MRESLPALHRRVMISADDMYDNCLQMRCLPTYRLRPTLLMLPTVSTLSPLPQEVREARVPCFFAKESVANWRYSEDRRSVPGPAYYKTGELQTHKRLLNRSANRQRSSSHLTSSRSDGPTASAYAAQACGSHGTSAAIGYRYNQLFTVAQAQES